MYTKIVLKTVSVKKNVCALLCFFPTTFRFYQQKTKATYVRTSF